MTKDKLTYKDYLNGLPPDRRASIDKVWSVIRRNIGKGYAEEIGPKFLCFKVDADWYVALANQKSYMSLYLMPVYVFPELKAKLDNSGKKLKCGKSCINFNRADDLPLDTIEEIVSAFDAKDYQEQVRQIRSAHSKKSKGRARSRSAA